MLNCTRLKNQCTTPFEFSKRSHYVNQTLPSVYLSVPASRWKHERRELMVCVQKCTKDSELCKLFSPSQISVLFCSLAVFPPDLRLLFFHQVLRLCGCAHLFLTVAGHGLCVSGGGMHSLGRWDSWRLFGSLSRAAHCQTKGVTHTV